MLTKEQHDGLHERLVIYRASDPSITQSDVIRDAIDRYLGEVRQKEELKNGKTI
jgi:hypothetical protein